MITTVVADGKNEYEFIDLLKKRAQNSDKNVVPIVSEIIENVAENGDKAVKEYTVKFDGKAPEKVEITSDEIDSLIEKCDKDYLETIKKAAAYSSIAPSTGSGICIRLTVIFGMNAAIARITAVTRPMTRAVA